MNDLADFVHRLTDLFDALGLPYMLTGSVVSTFYGTPRTTQDVDVVLQVNGRDVKRLVDGLDPDAYYVSESAALDAVRLTGQFNIIDMHTGWKADLIICKKRAFSRTEFERRVLVPLLGREVWVASVEDAIVSKLEWSNKGSSERQLRDVRGMLAHRYAELDSDYIEHWVTELALEAVWQKVRPAAS